MKKAVYFFGFIVLTIGDCIIGYKSADAFGITELSLMIVWASAFSLLSLPLKMIYDYLNSVKIDVSDNSRPKIIPAGKIIFSAIWLYVAYLALSGVSEVRRISYQKSMVSFSDVSNTGFENDTMKVRNRFDLRVKLENIRNKAKADSIILNHRIKAEEGKINLQNAIVTQYRGDYFLYINLIFVLSAAVCLSVSLEKIKIDEKAVFVQNNNTVYQDIPESDSTEIRPEEPAEEPKQEKTEKVECNCCKRRFTSLQSFRGHIRKDSTCQKTDYLIL